MSAQTSNGFAVSNQEVTRRNLQVVPLTREYSESFYNLIQEQAEQHHSASHKHTRESIEALYTGIVEGRGCDCFLIADADTQQALAAVTYYDCHTLNRGAGIYLEDIVTTASARNHGIGKMAMTALAQITRHLGRDYLAWECADHNFVALNFYNKLGTDIETGSHTLRRTATDALPQVENDLLTYRRAQPSDLDGVLALTSDSDDTQKIKEWFLEQTGLSHSHNKTPVLAVATNKDTGEIEGFSVAYRSFSTFRVVSGLHVSHLAAKNNRPETAQGLLQFFDTIQKDKTTGWTGHTDVTVSRGSTDWVEGILGQLGFASLAYETEKMVPHHVSGDKLAALAERKTSLIDTLHSAHALRENVRGNRSMTQSSVLAFT